MDKIVLLTTLPDPCNDRKIAADVCPLPCNRPLPDSLLFPTNELPDVEVLRQFYSRQGSLTKTQCERILRGVTTLFRDEPNLVKLSEPVCVVGDIHGQYYDLEHIFSKAGYPSKELNYLFLGDYVDRGVYGIEVCLLLFALKLRSPKHVVLLRGNHESRNMTEAFTFRQEVVSKYDIDLYDLFMDVFDTLPLASVVANKYLAMHGGISPDLAHVDEINSINRFEEVPLSGVFCDLLWSDPMDDAEAVNG
jgi:serine/threonine-protein phosphatase 2B catalytic subunit